jgi:hypothetical protein
MSGKYFFVLVEPGEHHLCAMLQSFPEQKALTRLRRVSVHSLKAEPGGTYYFRARLVGISTGFVLQLDQLDSDEGPRDDGLLLGRSSALRIPRSELLA